MLYESRVKKGRAGHWWAALCAFFLIHAIVIAAEAEEWPQEINAPEGVVVVYQPQPEKLEGNKLKARAAVALELKGSKEPVFGAVWFEARLDTDRAERTATIWYVKVTDVRFPGQDEEKTKRLRDLLEQEMPKWQLVISMDRLLASLERVEMQAEAAGKINTEPPKIIFISEPAVLVTIDGEPRLQELEGAQLMRVVNTPFTLLYHSSQKTYYLYADKDTWYTAQEIGGEWSITKKVPQEVAMFAPPEAPDGEAQDPEEEAGEPGPPPKVIVRTEPAELISSTGKPEYSPLTGTDLLYMSNTDSDVLMDIKEQKHYVLLSGRWYVGSNMEGPWQFVPGDELPADFAVISEASEMGTVLYAVPGTEVAEEAVLDAQIPQTAAIDRKKASLTVEYDGKPKLEKISGTKMSYAANTATPVIKVNKQYYACDEAVWFEADDATGPWSVATSVPDEIYTIPADCPVYHVTFVRIYDATPEVVYVGYTPGYTHTYVYHTTIVYGTGYYWPGWYGYYYYPRPATWGFHVRYNPWTGWGFGYSYCSGPFRFTVGVGGWYRGGWWGPRRYHGDRGGYRHGYSHGRRSGYRAGYRAGQRNSSKQNMYRTQRNQARSTPTATTANRAQAGAGGQRANNVYADRNGNVHRKTDQGWDKRTSQGWQSERGEKGRGQKPSHKPSQPSSGVSSPSQTQQQLNQSYQSRQQGNQRTQSYNSSRGRAGGGARGGGGGRMGVGGRR